MTKDELQSLSDDELAIVHDECGNRVRYLMHVNEYSEIQWDVIRTNASGEMGNMFVCLRDHNISSAKYFQIRDDMKQQNPEQFKTFWYAAKDWCNTERERHRRFWAAWSKKQKAREKERKNAVSVDFTA